MTILLELDLISELVEDIGSHPIERMLARRRLVLRTLVDRLADAAKDPDVVGLLVKIGATSISLAQAQELSDAVERFRASGKDAIAWAETFGELGRGTTAYVLASAFGEVWLQPSGSVGLMGASATGVFVRGALDRAHVEPLFAQRHEYKSAVDSLLRTEFSEAHREASERLAASTYEQIVSTVAERRRLSEDRVRELIDRSADLCRRGPRGRARRSPRVSRCRSCGGRSPLGREADAALPLPVPPALGPRPSGPPRPAAGGRARFRPAGPSARAGPGGARSGRQRVQTPSPRRFVPRYEMNARGRSCFGSTAPAARTSPRTPSGTSMHCPGGQ